MVQFRQLMRLGCRDFTFRSGSACGQKGTPKDVIAKLNSAAVTALADPTVRTLLTDLGFGIYSRDQQTPEEAEIDRWWPIIKAAGIKAQ
jgi:tripartite-type tricarboxylate transporter receptor subunit TctC